MKKRSLGFWFVFLWLLVGCLICTVLLAFTSVRLAAVALVLTAACGGVLFLTRNRVRRAVAGCVIGNLQQEHEDIAALQALQVPVAVTVAGKLVWFNDRFVTDILSGKEMFGADLRSAFPMLNAEAYCSPAGQCISLGNARYTVHGTADALMDNACVLYFFEDTLLKNKADAFDSSRPAVLHIVIDTYDELRRDLRTAELGHITGEIQDAITAYIARFSRGFVIRMSSERFLAVVEEQDLARMVADRFSLLDTARGFGGDSYVTSLSIGVCHAASDFAAAEEGALAALDLALGRGGDQTAIKDADGYSFFGGVSRSVEKRSRVKARIIASSLKELIRDSSNVIIMGHRFSDMDCLGAAMGMLRFCKAESRPACIAIDRSRSLAGSMIRRFEEEGLGRELVDPGAALQTVNAGTLLIIVDTHVPDLLESKELFEAIPSCVIIDHHRKMVGFIEDALVFYHESYASSASELVSELLPYVTDRNAKVLPVEAEALLAGIMLDTRDFTVHTGVRTFEAAGYLRRLGAQTANVKQLFSESLEVYGCKCRIVTGAYIYRNIAISLYPDLPENMRVAVPQAANDLLGVQGVSASVVAVSMGDNVNISARSMGAVNVQLIMEKMQGGGHQMMAGTQLRGVTLEQTKLLLQDAIDEYWAENVTS